MFKRCFEIPGKIAKHGFAGSHRIIIQRLQRFWETRIPWPIKGRFYYHLLKLILTPSCQGKRILGIWDYKALPWSIGDPLVFIEMLSILKIRHNAKAVDICIVYDHDNPGGNRGRLWKSNITSENAQDYMLEFLPMFSTSPYLGSIFQFSSRKEFYYFLRENSERYDIFPPLGQHLNETYNYYYAKDSTSQQREIVEFYHAYGYIPHLRISDRDCSWARWFYLTHLTDGTVPVALSMKRTSHDTVRNAEPAVWLAFIDKCKMHFPEVIFVVVGLREEVFDGLRNRMNTIIAKDFGTTITEDFALIRTSLLYMGTTSGICNIARFSDVPYLIFQFPNFYRNFGLEQKENQAFATDKQKIFDTTSEVTPELLYGEFKNLYMKLNKDGWQIAAIRAARMKNSHPSTRAME